MAVKDVHEEPPDAESTIASEAVPVGRDVLGVCHNAPLCTLCGSLVGRFEDSLYDRLVCRACRRGFINRRILASFIDYVLVLGAMAVFAGRTRSWMTGAAAIAVEVLAPPVVLLILVLRDGIGGRSPGKWLLGLTVIRADNGRTAGLTESVKRNLILLVPGMIYYLPFTLGRGLRIGDRWANTRVIWNRYRLRPPFVAGNFCAGCGYDLTGNVSGVCPECGTRVPEHLLRKPPQAVASSRTATVFDDH